MLLFCAIHAEAGQNLFIVKKSLHAKNIFKVDAQVDSNCALVPYPNHKYIEGYWIMGEDRGQREEMNSTEAQGFASKAVMTYLNTNRTEMDFQPANMDKARRYFSDPRIRVRTKVANGRCQVDAFMEIDNAEIKLKEIFVDLSMLLRIDYVTVRGVRADGSGFYKLYR